MPSAATIASAFNVSARYHIELAEQAADRDMLGQMGVFKFEAERALNRASLACDIAERDALDNIAKT